MSDEPSRIWSQEMGMQLAQDGENLRLAVKDCAAQLGPVQRGWTRYAKVAVIDLPPPKPTVSRSTE